ncbi:MAG TPA: hypothetical protein ENG66_09795, partial [Thermococcus sp.]|nr:hypothetical protein [Thermococcus sp.]
ELKAGVGLSRKWDAREAGREVAETALEKLEGEKPKFFLLFSTIHYEKYGGFQELLNGVWEVLPEGTPLIGGTVAGFMNNYGCFTRGATALTVAYPNMDVAVGVGHNVKRNPLKAAEKSVSNVKKESRYDNRILIELLPTAVVPNIPGVGQKVVISSEKIGNQALKLLPKILYLNMGYDRADEVIEILTNTFGYQKIIGGCTMDDNRMLRSYQFLNRDYFKNSLCIMQVDSDIKHSIYSSVPLERRKGSFMITKTDADLHVIREINHKGAKSALLEMLKWRDAHLPDSIYSFYKKIFYYPFGFEKKGQWHACMIGGFWGENIILSVRAEKKDMQLLSLSIEKLFNTTKNNLQNIKENNAQMCFSVACETFMETLGNKIYEYQKLFSSYIDIPYLVVFMAGESVSTPEIGCHHLYEAINIWTM